MKTSRFIISVHGRSTRSTAALWTRDGHLLSRARGGLANISIDCEASIATIDELWRELGTVVGLDRHSGRADAILSLAVPGAGLEASRANCFEAFSGFADCAISSDGYCALIGAFGGGPGAILTVGSGVSACRITQNGKFEQFGGWGFPASDRGGGAWLGLQLISDYLQALDGTGSIIESSLWPVVEETLGTSRHEILAWLQTANSKEFAQFAPAILQAAEAGDEEALDLVEASVLELRTLAARVCGEPRLPFQLCGQLGRALKDRLNLAEGTARASQHRGAYLIGLGEVEPEFSS